MSEKDGLEILQVIKKYVVIGILSLIFSVIISMTAFYFNTTNKLKEHDNRIDQMEEKCADKEMIDVKLNYIVKNIDEIKEQLKMKE